jgi:plasmid stabilization system protein ParE
MSATFEVSIGPEAEADLFEIYAYIAERSGRLRAGKYVERIEAFCLSLDTFPEQGAKRDDLRPNLRTIVYRRQATIVYTIDGPRVVILRVFNAGQDYEGALREEAD